MDLLLKEIKGCTLCEAHLPLAPRPILSFERNAKILLIGQAPGKKAHDSQIPWNDASGARLREWLGVTVEAFYDPSIFAIVPMGFCYPGKGTSGDLPPRPECAKTWMSRVLRHLTDVKLTILIGAYSQDRFLKTADSVTENVRNWRRFSPQYFPLPHPSPRNNIWLSKNSWFGTELLPELKAQVRNAMKQ